MSRPYSSRFATRTARTQRIGQRGKKQACFAQPKGEWGQTWPSLALSRGEQELTCAGLGPNLRQTRTQLEPNWGPTWRTFGCKLGLACATWSFVGSGAEVGPKTSPMWATWPRTSPPISPHQSQKMLEKAVKSCQGCERSDCAQLIQVSSNLPQLGTFWRQLRTKLGPTETQHGEH